TVGSDAIITFTANMDGRQVEVAQTKFRVRKLPDPTPFISFKDASGNTQHYKGGPRRLAKAALMSASGLGAALDDGVLNITYQVVSFSTVFFDSMGNAIPENSAGASFSARQIEQFKRLKVGKSFFITDIKAKGPDGITREIPPMQVTLN
ncbi:MAG: gliding motility protein GldM, partial [Muribaculaceae bacterium]|nr:gliding motility protein GldM [Muribaculaceae bacterium]